MLVTAKIAPIAKLLNDDSVNDILINGPNRVYAERNGKLEKTDIVFENDDAVRALAEAIAEQVGRTLEADRPMIDARLEDGSRVNIIAPPLAIDGTSISIRKFYRHGISLDNMAVMGNLSPELAEFLKVCGHSRLNIIISGGTGAGKTTLLNAIAQHVDPAERVVTVEDAAELNLPIEHVVRLETRPPRLGEAADMSVSIRDLVKNALRMRPERIIVGEVRGAEAFDMLQAMNTGHEGSLATIHANHPRDALSRLENMVSMADLGIPLRAIRAQIGSALHLVIQVSRMRDGIRRVAYVSEITGMEGDIVTMHDLWQYHPIGEDAKGVLRGEYRFSGITPRFTRRAAYWGELERLSNSIGMKLSRMV